MPKRGALILSTVCFLIFIVFIISARSQHFLAPGAISSEHKKLTNKCTTCHQPLQGVPDEKCLFCHTKVALEKIKNKGIHANLSKNSCAGCHVEHKGGSEAKAIIDTKNFNHDLVSFSLNQHKKENCNICHINKYTDFSFQICSVCHLKRKTNFSFHLNQYGSNCLKCHNGKTNTFRHPQNQDFFAGKHSESLKCALCHKNNVFNKISTDCVNCHKLPLNHFNIDCLSCHNTNSWNDVNFNHPYVGRHDFRSFPCQYCHPQGYKTYSCSRCHDSKGNSLER